MPTSSIKIDSASKKTVLLLAAAACLAGAWFFARWGMANSAAMRTEDPDVAVYLTQLAPSDPQTHYSAAVLLERSFDLANVEKALSELEQATALSPDNYLLWLDLGRARERAGDAQGAERALRRAIELAPNYSHVQWALGNALLRQGRTEDAFAEIRKAVAGNVSFGAPAVAAAWQFFGGDVEAIRRAAGGVSGFDLALVTMLLREKRVDEAMWVWRSVPPEERPAELGTAIINALLEGKRFRDAGTMAADLNKGIAGSIGQISNGGFESAVKPEGAGPFEWQIGAGLQPHIVLSTGQKHGGANSLLLVFNSTSGADFRTVSQTVAVEPNTENELEVFYRSDLKSSAAFRWEVVDAADSKQLAVTEPVALRSNWAPLRVRFRVPSTSDGIIVRLAREECGQVCTVNGNLWFDDVVLRRATR